MAQFDVPHDAYALRAAEFDAYRIEFETASRTIATGAAPAFGRADAVDQAAAIEAVRTAAAAGATVTLPPTGA